MITQSTYTVKSTVLTYLMAEVDSVLQRRSQATDLEMLKWTVRLEAARGLTFPVAGDGWALPEKQEKIKATDNSEGSSLYYPNGE